MDIKSVIKKYGETTYTVAEKMGIAQPSVMQYINGNPTARKLEDIARAIGCSPAEFFADWKGETHQPAVEQPAAPNTEASPADNLPFTNEQQPETEKAPSVVTQGALICPHCGKPFAVEVRG